VFARDVAVHRTNAEGRRNRVIGQAEIVGNHPHQAASLPPIVQLLAQENVQHGAARVESLQVVLVLKHLEQIIGVGHRKMSGVGVVGSPVSSGRDNIREALLVGSGQAVGSPLSRRCLEIVEVAGFTLEPDQHLAHEIQHADSESLPLRTGNADAEQVQTSLVHSIEPDGGEVIAPVTPHPFLGPSQIVAAVGVEALLGEKF